MYIYTVMYTYRHSTRASPCVYESAHVRACAPFDHIHIYIHSYFNVKLHIKLYMKLYIHIDTLHVRRPSF